MKFNKKVKLFTHNDLDGVGCAILGKFVFDDIDIEYCGYNNINQNIKKCDFSKYDIVFITDISVNEEIAVFLNDINSSRIQLNLIDHHKTAIWLNDYSWASVQVEKNEKLQSGTSLFYDSLVSNRFLNENIYLKSFCDNVRKYDTWEWKSNGEIFPKDLNDLFKILGLERFLNRIYTHFVLNNKNFDFDILDKQMLEMEREKIEKYINDKNSKLIKLRVENYNAGIVFGENYISELGNKICEMNEDLDFSIVIINNNAISFRTIKDIDLSLIAQKFGGGGHKKASGSPVSEKQTMEILKILGLNNSTK